MLLGQISIFYMFLASAANELWQTMETERKDVDGVLRAALPVRTQLNACPSPLTPLSTRSKLHPCRRQGGAATFMCACGRIVFPGIH